jgi:transposase
MPQGVKLTNAVIQQRMIEWRNLKQMYGRAKARLEQLLDENKQLKKELAEKEAKRDELHKQAKELEEKLRQQEDTNKKLRAMLFEKQHGKPRTKRPHTSKPRTASSYTRPQPKQITEHRELVLDSCPHCETPVSDPVSSRTRIIEDIVFNPKPRVIEWTIHRHWCTGCGKQVSGQIPGILPKTRIGPHTLTFVVLAKYRWMQPYAKIQDQLKTTFGLHISEGEIAGLIARAAHLVGEKWERIIQAVKAGQTVHCDETGWHINGKKVWAHTFATDYAVLYEISPTRGKQIAENQFQGFEGTRVTDCLPNYKNLSGQHQICWAHLTREAQENWRREEGSKERKQMTKALDRIYADLREVTGQKQWNQSHADRIRRRCERRVKRLIKQHWRDPACRRLANRLADFNHALFTCLSAPGIPPDNNHAERVLRKLVVQRKISGGNRSPTHAEHHAKLMSVVETLRLEEGELLTNLQQVLQQGVATRLSGG